jgi:hypothetical protein
MDSEFKNMEANKQGIRDILSNAGASDEDIAAYMAGDSTAVQNLSLGEEEMNALMEYTDGVMEAEDAILELRESIES